MQPLRLKPVVFCGENPHIVLVDEQTNAVRAAASYWQSTYSPHGEGQALLLYLNADNSSTLAHPALKIYADNEPLARYLADNFNQHFEDWQTLGFASAAIEPARFTKESDSRDFYRVTCQSETAHIELLWGDIRGRDFRTMPDLQGGGFGANRDEHYDVANVIFVCAEGTITVNQRRASGVPQTAILENGRFASSVFIALSEVWLKRESDAV